MSGAEPMSSRPITVPTQIDQAQNRKTLREMQRELLDNKPSYTSVTSNGLSKVQQRANEMFSVSATESRSTALDAGILKTVSELGAAQACNLDKAGETFIRQLKSKFAIGMGGNSDRTRINWKRLAESVDQLGVYMDVPAVTFVVGEFVAAAPKQKKERKRKERVASEPVQTADTVSVKQLQEQAEEKAQTARMKVMEAKVAEISGKHGDRGRVNLFQLILHPTSFSQSVENLFDLAFLVKDGRVAIETDDQCAYVRGAKPPEKGDFAHGLIKKQNILSLDHPTYQRLAERWCSRGEALLPSRTGRVPPNTQQSASSAETANSQGASGTWPARGGIDLADDDDDDDDDDD